MFCSKFVKRGLRVWIYKVKIIWKTLTDKYLSDSDLCKKKKKMAAAQKTPALIRGKNVDGHTL